MAKSKEITARDLMQTEVIELQASTPIREAVETFEEYNISGAPVVNEVGELVGVLSESDIVKVEHVDLEGSIQASKEFYERDPLEAGDTEEESETFSKEDYDPDLLESETVGDWMTAKVISVTSESSLKEICSTMAREQIHRVFVVNGKKLQGVISTFDIVRYLAETD